MAAGRKILRGLIAAVAGLFFLVAAALYLLTSTSLAGRLVSAFTQELLDADLKFSRLDLSLFRSWPDVNVRLDSVCVTYPHSRFEMVAEMPLQGDGCGDGADTLLRCVSLEASARLIPLLKGNIDISGVDADALRVYAHNYGNGMANWNVFASSSGGGSLPEISLRRLHLSRSLLTLSSKSGLWRIAVPVDAELAGSLGADSLGTNIEVEHLRGMLGWMPLSLSGAMKIQDESTGISARLTTVGAPVDTLIREYLYPFVPKLKGSLEADGLINLDASLEGSFSGGLLPAISAKVKLPSSRVAFRPYRIDGRISLDGRFNSDPRMIADAFVDKLSASVPGLSVEGSGQVEKLFGKDPHYRAKLSAYSVLETLSGTYLKGTGIAAGGDVDLKVELDALQSQLDRYHFSDAYIKGSLSGSRLDVRYDSLRVKSFAPLLRLSSGPDGIAAGLDLDSTFLHNGKMNLKLRDSRTLARVSKPGTSLPRMELLSDNGSLFMGIGGNKAGIRGINLVATAQKRARRDSAAFRRRAASDTSWVQRHKRFARQETMREFRDKDVRVYLDSSLTALIRQWDATVSLNADRGFAASTALPLRTRLGALKADFDGRDLRLDTLSVNCGTSDLRASGRLKNLRRVFSQRRSFIDASMDLKSSRININELIAAMDYAKEHIPSNLAAEDESDSFVLDSIPDARPESSDLLIVVPGNVDAELRLNAGRVDYRNFKIAPARLRAKVHENTVQLLDVFADAGIGKMEMDAFYSTKSRKDISAGASLLLREIRAEDAIQVLPFVDSLIPALKSFKGKIDCKLSADASFDDNMNLITPSLQGVLDIHGKNLHIDDAGDLRRITRLLMFKDKNIGDIDDLSVSAVVKDSKVEIYPFQLGVDRYRLALQGIQGFDKSMNYHVSVLKSPFLIPFGIYVRGSLDNWHFGLSRARYRDGAVPAYTRQLDSVGVNFAKSIKDIFRMGVDGIRNYNTRSINSIDSPMGARRKVLDEMLDTETYKQLDALELDNEIAAQEAELRESIEAMLADF